MNRTIVAILACVVLGVSSVFAQLTEVSNVEAGFVRCATRTPSDIELRLADHQIRKVKRHTQQGPIAIQVFFHIIHDGQEGDISDKTIDAQVVVLNLAFTETPFHFVLAGVTRTNNAAWFTARPGSADELKMKATLRRGTARDLNIYTNKAEGPVLGWATFPWTAAFDSLGDGVVVFFATLPGGSAKPYDKGDTAVHEIGHWLGLLHVFMGECDGKDDSEKKGDYVKDTPRQKGPTFGCPEPGTVDTCPDKKDSAKDPTENFMDYTEDDCMYGFSRGQSSRANEHWNEYRQSSDEPPPP